MEKLFHIEIVTPAKVLYAGEASSLVVPAQLGYLGVLANHAPLIANLVPGKIIVRDNSDTPTVFEAKSKGFLEVLKNKATILVDSAESSVAIE